MTSITKGAVDSGSCRRPAYFYRSAREGMRQLLEGVRAQDPRGVLLPGYIGRSDREGSGVLDPVTASGAPVGFYDLEADLSPVVDGVSQLAGTGRYGVLVVIHYFGRAARGMDELRRIADRNRMLLVEDLAHAFFTATVGEGAGRHGDVNLYSIHKMFPVPDGGMVTYADPALAGTASSTFPELAAEVLSYDWPTIADRRRSRFREVTARLADLPEHGDAFELLWPELSEHDVPQSVPLRVTGDNRDAVYHDMNAHGFGAVSLYHTLIDEVDGRFPALEHLSRHVINLPCHQDVDPDAVGPMIDRFRRALREA